MFGIDSNILQMVATAFVWALHFYKHFAMIGTWNNPITTYSQKGMYNTDGQATPGKLYTDMLHSKAVQKVLDRI